MRLATALPFCLLLAACAGDPATDENEGDTLSEAGNIVTPTDFDLLALGGIIEGPLGPTVEASLADGNVALADMMSRVQCPADIDPCVPADNPPGTIYTYIHEVRPGFDGPNDEGIAMPASVEPVERAESFALDFPANGFTGVAGYAIAEADEALATGFNATISCENGRIVWTVPEESGWSTGETITFFWQTTRPPSGPDGQYRFVAHGRTVTGRGPKPRGDRLLPAVCE